MLGNFDQPSNAVYSAMLRDFGVTKKRAVEDYTRLVEARLGEKSQDDYYREGVSGDEASRSGASTRGRQFGIDELRKALRSKERS